MEEQLTKKKAIRSKLLALDVEDSTTYHRSQRDSVTSTRDQLQVIHPDKKWRLSKVDSETFKVTRIA